VSSRLIGRGRRVRVHHKGPGSCSVRGGGSCSHEPAWRVWLTQVPVVSAAGVVAYPYLAQSVVTVAGMGELSGSGRWRTASGAVCPIRPPGRRNSLLLDSLFRSGGRTRLEWGAIPDGFRTRGRLVSLRGDATQRDGTFGTHNPRSAGGETMSNRSITMIARALSRSRSWVS
jgi:hypothetical protein